MDWMDAYLDGIGAYKTTISPADTRMWGVKPKLNNVQERMIFDAAAQSEQEFRQIVQEARTALEAHGHSEVADAVGADPGSPARASSPSVTPTITPTPSITPTITPTVSQYPGMLAANSPLIAVNYGNISTFRFGTNQIVTRNYGYAPDIVWDWDSGSPVGYYLIYLDFSFNIPGAWSFQLFDSNTSSNRYQWKNNSTNSMVVPSAGWYGFYNVPTSASVLILSAIPVSPTPTPTITPTITPTRTQTPTVTPTISVTPTITPTISITPTITPTITVTPTVSRSVDPNAFGTPRSILFGGDFNYSRRQTGGSAQDASFPALSVLGGAGYYYYNTNNGFYIFSPGSRAVDPDYGWDTTFSEWSNGQFVSPDMYGNGGFFDGYGSRPAAAYGSTTDPYNMPNIWQIVGGYSVTYFYATLTAGPIAVGLSATTIYISGISAGALFNTTHPQYYGGICNSVAPSGYRGIFVNSQPLTKVSDFLWQGPAVGTYGDRLILSYGGSSQRYWSLMMQARYGPGCSFTNDSTIFTNAEPLTSRGIPLSGWNPTGFFSYSPNNAPQAWKTNDVPLGTIGWLRFS